MNSKFDFSNGLAIRGFNLLIVTSILHSVN
ncbi:Uncharacterised protein [Mycobacterium tuberculosis]|nr:Uncharacterised protein [Mycobacterium tuberculosis]